MSFRYYLQLIKQSYGPLYNRVLEILADKLLSLRVSFDGPLYPVKIDGNWYSWKEYKKIHKKVLKEKQKSE